MNIRLSLPLPPQQVLRRESPRNEMYNIVVASPELWRPRELSPAADDSSASSGIAADDDDLLGAPPPELDAANEFVDEEAHLLMPDDTTPLHAFRGQFAALRAEPCSEEVWSRFVALVDEMTTEAAVIVKLPVRSDGRTSGNRTAIDRVTPRQSSRCIGVTGGGQ